MRLWASFLNNSSSRWEPIWENWPLQIDMVDNVSPIYRSDFTRWIFFFIFIITSFSAWLITTMPVCMSGEDASTRRLVHFFEFLPGKLHTLERLC